ncbi:DUF2231 domain-containing protein [Pseudonocardia sulfidoxydans]|nr:DUF2231 domain-containing protein [Pseudonocardia sulfidoxydans]
MFTIGGIPAHPLVVHAVVVLLPLAAIGAVVIAVRPSLRRTLGVAVTLVALAGVVAVPVATQSGSRLLATSGGGGPLVGEHADRAGNLLPWAVLFLALLLVSVVTGKRADRTTTPADAAGGGVAVQTRTTTLHRVSTVTGVLAALAGIAVTALVVWIGDAGAQSVWQGIGG